MVVLSAITLKKLRVQTHVDMETEPSEVQLQIGPVGASYSGLYKEGEFEHTNVQPLTSLNLSITVMNV